MRKSLTTNIIKLIFFIVILTASSCNNEKKGIYIETVAGNGTFFEVWYKDGMDAKKASITPDGIFIDKGDNLYISLLYDIAKIDLKEGLIYRFAGDGVWSLSTPGIGDGGNALLAKIAPNDITQDSDGNFYILDVGNHRIRKIDRQSIISTFVGGGSNTCPKDLSYPDLDGCFAGEVYSIYADAIAINQQDEIYWTEIRRGNIIYKLDSNGIIRRVAGMIDGYLDTGDGGLARNASLEWTMVIKFDSMGRLFIATRYRVRMIDTAGIITTIAGDGTDEYRGENIPATSQGMMPVGILPDNEGGIYILDSANYRLYYVDAGGIIRTVAGNGIPGPYGDGGDPLQASIAPCGFSLGPAGMAFDSKGNLYFSDTCNARVRRIVFN